MPSGNMTAIMMRIARLIQSHSLTEPPPVFQSLHRPRSLLPARSLAHRHRVIAVGARTGPRLTPELNLYNVEAGVQGQHGIAEHRSARPKDGSARDAPGRQFADVPAPHRVRHTVVAVFGTYHQHDS